MYLSHQRESIEISRKFTIIELLVVMVIIVILASLLFPLLANAKKSVKQTACLNNMRQHSLTWQMYFSDNQEYFCPAGHDYSYNWVSVFLSMGYYASGGWPQAFMCPEQPALNERVFATVYTDYGYNFTMLTAFPYYSRVARISDISSPSKTILLTDACYSPTSAAPGRGSSCVYTCYAGLIAAPRHNRCVNYLCIDGHASYKRTSNSLNAYTQDALGDAYMVPNYWTRKGGNLSIECY